MPVYVGSNGPTAAYVGSSTVSAMYFGGVQVFPNAAPPTTQTLYNDSFTGTTGAAPAAAWTKATNYPTASTVTIQSNAMRVSTNSTTAWTPGGAVFLGDPSKPEGNSSTGAPAIVSDAEYYFDYTLSTITAEHYPTILLRGRSAEMWSGGNGANLFTTGYQLVLGVTGSSSTSFIDVIQGYNAGNAAAIAHVPVTFPNVAMKFHILIQDSMLYVRLWAASTTEAAAFPSGTWTISGAYVPDQGDGSIGFGIANGPAAATKTVTIDNFTSTTPILGIGTTTSAPTAEKSGFTRVYTEDFTDTAPSGTGTSSFLNVYSTRIQPYDEVSPNYQQRALLSAHDSVMDVAMNGTQGAAWAWGSVSTANSWVGGRFSMRAKAVGAYNNGPAVMIWPSNNAWVEGEIDFPESVSGAGGTQGFQDAPWIHHHTMNTDHPNDQSAAQDVPLLVSWRDWHVYTAEWYPPGKGPNPTTGLVIYYVDDVEIYRTTTDIPKTNHRFMAQVGAYGTAGNMYIDWVTMASLN